MSPSPVFRITSHVIDCQHIREYPRATAGRQEEVLKFAIKQYTPLDNLSPKDGDVTIIAAHANGFPKELYEPLWEAIYRLSKEKNAAFRLRGIWMADVANQGESGVVNERKLGNDPFDHSRDLLHMVNHFRDQMPRPIVGIGHSIGGMQITQLSLIHPRLLTSLILLDPVINVYPPRPTPASSSTFRRDIWPSRSAAATAFKKNNFYASWNPAVLDKWIKYGLRDLPTPLYPSLPSSSSSSSSSSASSASAATSSDEKPVTLTTTKHQEVFSFVRPNYNAQLDGKTGKLKVDRSYAPDLDPDTPNLIPPTMPADTTQLPLFYLSASSMTFHQLPHVRPSVLYIFGGASEVSVPAFRAEKVRITGVGVGGSGGAAEGMVEQVVLEGVGHLVAMEEKGLPGTAEAVWKWLGREVGRWRVEEERYQKEWVEGVRLEEKAVVDEAWKRNIRIDAEIATRERDRARVGKAKL